MYLLVCLHWCQVEQAYKHDSVFHHLKLEVTAIEIKKMVNTFPLPPKLYVIYPGYEGCNRADGITVHHVIWSQNLCSTYRAVEVLYLPPASSIVSRANWKNEHVSTHHKNYLKLQKPSLGRHVFDI